MESLLKISIFFFASLVSAFSHAQDNVPEFGKVDIADLNMKECPFDKGAGAMNLISSEYAELNATPGSYSADIERWVRIKIFSQKGFSSASVDIPYFGKGKLFNIAGLTAFTYNINNEGNVVVTKVEKSDIFREKANDGNGSLRFAFPGVKPGSIIEYKYTLKEKNILLLPPWIFQDIIPTRLSICSLKYMSGITVNFRLHTNLTFETETDTAKVIVEDIPESIIRTYYLVRDLPAFKEEPLMSSLIDNMQRIEFGVRPSNSFSVLAEKNETLDQKWHDYNLQLLKSRDFGQQFRCPIPGTEAFIDSVKNLASRIDKISAVWEQVKSTVVWDNSFDIFADNLASVWAAKLGSSAEINLTILNLLRKANVMCFPVLISTRQHGKTDTHFATLSQFNGVDVMAIDTVAKKFYILDGTQKHQSFNIPPYNVLNSNAFLVDWTNNGWIHVEDQRVLMTDSVNISASIDSAGIMTGSVKILYYDYAKADVLELDEERAKTNPKTSLLYDLKDVSIDSVVEQNAEIPANPLIKSFNFKLNMQQTGDFYFFDPFFLSPFPKNPFYDSSRETEIDFNCKQNFAININISLPDNMAATDLPDEKIYAVDSGFVFEKKAKITKSETVAISSSFSILKPIFPASSYIGLKRAFEKVYALLNERIVFKKTN